MTRDNDTEPLVRVVKGDPTPEELAALTAVIAAKLAARPAGSPDPSERVSDWSSYWRAVHAPAQHGPGRWRASAFPGERIRLWPRTR
jgi:acyl-CoA carboxylase epsilon subunit